MTLVSFLTQMLWKVCQVAPNSFSWSANEKEVKAGFSHLHQEGLLEDKLYSEEKLYSYKTKDENKKFHKEKDC